MVKHSRVVIREKTAMGERERHMPWYHVVRLQGQKLERVRKTPTMRKERLNKGHEEGQEVHRKQFNTSP